MRANSARMCSVRVDFFSMSSALDRVTAAAMAKRPLAVHFVNAYTLSLALSDNAYADLLGEADLNLPDGRPVVWAARLAGLADAEQVCGPDFMPLAFENSALRHYLYGSTEATLEKLEATLRSGFPEASIAGRESPPFRSLTQDEERAVVARIHESGANIVWVGLGTPKQDVFVERMKDRIGVPLLAVGAAFDFHAGSKTRPPAWISRVGLEWAHRLAQEPRRLARRYIVGNAKFLVGLVKAGVRAER